MKTVLNIAVLAAAASLLVLPSCRQEKGTPLFNGKDLAGWVAVTDPADSTGAAEGTFTVRQHVIAVSGTPNGYLRTEKPYNDYRVSLEFRWVGGKGTNSGFFQRLRGEDKIWPSGLECQLGAGHVGDFIGLGGYRIEGVEQNPSGFSFKPRTSGTDPEKPVGRWNEVVVECIGGHVRYTVNGVLQNECDIASSSGFIALQSEGGPLEFRNIRIREL